MENIFPVSSGRFGTSGLVQLRAQFRRHRFTPILLEMFYVILLAFDFTSQTEFQLKPKMYEKIRTQLIHRGGRARKQLFCQTRRV